MKILFPKYDGQHYYNTHYKFLYNLFMEAGVKIIFGENTEIDQTRFTIKINGCDCLIDFSDHLQLHETTKNYHKCFKFHYDYYTHKYIDNVCPFTPISFMDWSNYYNNEINYTCNNNIVLNNQKPYCNAKQRRNFVQNLLKEKYGNLLDISLTSKEVFWNKLNNCLVSVCVPGARNDILDRGQLQMMAFGVCTISPILRFVTPNGDCLVPWTHYIPCMQSYSDLIDKIEWCKNNREKCIQIGNNAKNWFYNFMIPNKIVEWIGEVM